MRLPSAGKLGIMMKCLGSFMLPQVKSESGHTPEAAEGNRIHGIIEQYLLNNRKEEGLEADSLAICQRLSRTMGPIPAGGERPECRLLVYPFKDGPDSLRVIGRDEDPTEEDRADAIYGICDYLGEDSPGSFRVTDFKTGAFYVPAPEWNWQLLLPAIGLYLASGRSSEFKCRANIIHVRESSIVLRGDESVYDCSPYTYDSQLIEHRLTMLQKQINKAKFYERKNVPLYEGKHCDYCNARARCPAKVGALEQAIKVVSGLDVTDIGMIKTAVGLIETKPQLDKAAKELIKIHGLKREVEGKTEYAYDLGDGREAVVAVDKRLKEKVFTRKV